MRESIEGLGNQVLVAEDGGRDVVLDRDVTLKVDGNYLIGDYIYQVVKITDEGTVYVKSI